MARGDSPDRLDRKLAADPVSSAEPPIRADAALPIACAAGVSLAPGWQAAVACIAHVYSAGELSVGVFLECALPACLATALGWLALSLSGVSARIQGRRSLCALGGAAAIVGFVVLLINELAPAFNGAFCALALSLVCMGGACIQAAWMMLIQSLGQDWQANLKALGDVPLWPIASSFFFIALSVASGFGGACVPILGMGSFLLPVVSCVVFNAADKWVRNGAVVADLVAEPQWRRVRFAGPSSLGLRHGVSSALLSGTLLLMTCNFLMTTFGKAEGWIAVAFIPGALFALAFLFLGKATHSDSVEHLAYRLLVFPVFMAYFPFNPGTEESLHFAFFFTYAALATFIVLAPLLACDLASRRNRGLVRSWGGMCAGAAAGGALGCLIAFAGKTSGVISGTYSIYLQAIACIALSVIATNLLFLDREDFVAAYADAARNTFGNSRSESLVKQCRIVAEQFGLTPREGEVLQVLARGYTLSRVCSDLGISQGTAISHRRNIYAKTGVHSQDELIDTVEAAAAQTRRRR